MALLQHGCLNGSLPSALHGIQPSASSSVPRSTSQLRGTLFGGRDVFQGVDVASRLVNGIRVRQPFLNDPWTLTVHTIQQVLAHLEKPSTSVHQQRDASSSSVLIEVGSWTGASTLHMVQEMKRREASTIPITPPIVISVDTWLGSPEFFTLGNTSWWEDMGFTTRSGYPTAFPQYLYNIASAGMAQHVVPFPQTSLVAAKVMYAKGILADAIYIDASHEHLDCKTDMEAYWELLRVGGIMFGDDYDWPGVKRAVDEFVAMRMLQLTLQPAVLQFGKPAPHGVRGKIEWILSPKVC